MISTTYLLTVALHAAVLSVLSSAVLLVAWGLGVAISGSQIPGISPQVRQSQVLVLSLSQYD